VFTNSNLKKPESMMALVGERLYFGGIFFWSNFKVFIYFIIYVLDWIEPV
jgi:hypothetical protein